MGCLFKISIVDLNLAFLNDCTYYSVNELFKLNLNNNLNIFHTNINGLESKFDSLHEFLSSKYSKMDIIAITEISQKTSKT